jgi:hypothetical protein
MVFALINKCRYNVWFFDDITQAVKFFTSIGKLKDSFNRNRSYRVKLSSCHIPL